MKLTYMAMAHFIVEMRLADEPNHNNNKTKRQTRKSNSVHRPYIIRWLAVYDLS